MLKNLLREPLVHFLLLGGALFAFWTWYGPEPETLTTEKPTIVISEARIDSLIDIWTKTRQRAPTQKELKGMIEDFLREEVFYREALALKLDEDDIIIRRRMRQKMELFVEDLASAAKPKQEELQRFLESRQESFRVDQKVSIRLVFINPDKHPNDLNDFVSGIKKKLKEGADPETLGDPFLLASAFEDVSVGRLDLEFGQGFGRRVAQIKPGAWSNPISSGFGLHLVFVDQSTAGRIPPLEEIQQQVEREWFAETRARAKEEFFQKLRDRYEVVVELPEPDDSGESK